MLDLCCAKSFGEGASCAWGLCVPNRLHGTLDFIPILWPPHSSGLPGQKIFVLKANALGILVVEL
jgi:hypothetical protein